MKLLPVSFKHASGFTLIELLVVIAVLGVLAGGVIVAINPVEQLSRGRDTGKKTAIAELGRGLNTYLTSQQDLPDGDDSAGGFASALVTTGDIRVIPQNPSSETCTLTNSANEGSQGGYCYRKNGTNEYVVYALAESNSEKLNANNGAQCSTGNSAYIVFSSAAGRTGVLCASTTAGPSVGVTSLN
jgi:prepilin-type N-terminal cleavage/methylation domain-containing protein